LEEKFSWKRSFLGGEANSIDDVFPEETPHGFSWILCPVRSFLGGEANSIDDFFSTTWRRQICMVLAYFLRLI
jgi:hypothetical protein